MAGWLDDLLGMQAAGQPLPGGLLAMFGQAGQSRGFPPLVSPEEEQAAAEEARAAAALRLAGKGPRALPPFVVSAPSPFVVGAPAGPDLYGNLTPADSAAPPAEATPTVGASPTPSSLPEQYGIPPSFHGGVPYFAPSAMAKASPQPSLPAAPAAPTQTPQPNILGTIGRNILQGLQDNSNALIAGGGAAMTGGLGRGFQAFAAAAPLDVAARQERQANQAIDFTQKALIARGIDPVQARAMALDPVFRKENMQPQQHVVITDVNGNQVPLSFNPATGRYIDAAGKPWGGPAATAGMTMGEDYAAELKATDPVRLTRATAILEGREQPPPEGSRAPQAQAMLNTLARLDPSGDYTKWSGRYKTVQDFSPGGKSGIQIKNAEQGLHHVSELIKSVEGLTDTGSPLFNGIYNRAKLMTIGNPEYRALMTNAHAVADEFGKMWKGGTNSDAEIRAWEAGLDPNMTREEWKAQIGKLMGLLHGSLAALETSRERGMSTGKSMAPLLSPQAQKTLDLASKWSGGQKVNIDAAAGGGENFIRNPDGSLTVPSAAGPVTFRPMAP